MRNPTHHEHEVEWRVADYLVSDVHIATARVHRFRWTRQGQRGRSRRDVDHTRARKKLVVICALDDDPRSRPFANHHRFLVSATRPDVADETISALRHGLNVLFAFLAFAERLAKYRNVLREVVLLDKTVGPNLSHQLFLRQYVV